jgi:hypothetical protein
MFGCCFYEQYSSPYFRVMTNLFRRFQHGFRARNIILFRNRILEINAKSQRTEYQKVVLYPLHFFYD